MDKIQEWIGTKFKEIAEKLPEQVHEDSASFSCGYNVGYKQAVLDLKNFILHQDEYL